MQLLIVLQINLAQPIVELACFLLELLILFEQTSKHLITLLELLFALLEQAAQSAALLLQSCVFFYVVAVLILQPFSFQCHFGFTFSNNRLLVLQFVSEFVEVFAK